MSLHVRPHPLRRRPARLAFRRAGLRDFKAGIARIRALLKSSARSLDRSITLGSKAVEDLKRRWADLCDEYEAAQSAERMAYRAITARLNAPDGGPPSVADLERCVGANRYMGELRDRMTAMVEQMAAAGEAGATRTR